MSETSEQKLNQIKEDFLSNLEESIFIYITEYLNDESNRQLPAYESDIYTYKALIEKYFPEIDVPNLMEDFKEKALEKVQEDPCYCHDEQLFDEMKALFD